MTGAKKRKTKTCFQKKLRLSLAWKKKSLGSHYNFLDEDKKSLVVKSVCENTAKSTQWALTNFADWSHCYKELLESHTSEHIPDDILAAITHLTCASG